jgi:hypothetical protein
MRLTRPQGVATDREPTAGAARRRLGAGAVRLLSVTAIATATCSLWMGAASAATAAPAAGGTTSTTTITTASPGTVDAGDSFTIAVQVTGAGGTPTGTVEVAPNTPTGLPAPYSCEVTLSGGTGSCKVTPGAGTFGDVYYTATYSGDGTFAGSASNGDFELAVPESTTTSVSPAAAKAGTVALVATVVGEDEGNISPTAGGSGTVTFYNGETVIAGCAAVGLVYNGGGGNLATCDATLAAGSYAITAKYSGDLNNLASNGDETLVVSAPPPAKHASKTSGSASPGSTTLRKTVTLSASVTSSGGTPGGKVTFRWQGHVVCSATLSHGKAHCAIKFLKTGTYKIRAWYAGSSTFDASNSGFFKVTIKS